MRRIAPFQRITGSTSTRPSIAGILLVATAASGQSVDLTHPDWIITGRDIRTWDGSILVFTSQTRTAGGWELEGYADWISLGVFRGRELLEGTLDDDLNLEFAGYELINPRGIVLTDYTARVTPDGRSIVDGTWGGGAAPGVWSATRACRADLDGDGELTVFDFLAFQNLFDAGDLRADFDDDGDLTIFDFLGFQNAFDAGCA